MELTVFVIIAAVLCLTGSAAPRKNAGEGD